MKKLLILMLVLGMASVANATVLSWSADAVTIPSINATVVVTLDADDNVIFSPKWVGNTPASPSIASITSIVARAAAGPDSQVKNPTDTTYAGWWTVMTLDLATPITIESGAQWDVTIKGFVEGTFGLASDNYGTNDTLEVTVLPEPMTIAMLGLGSLFLLRRKK